MRSVPCGCCAMQAWCADYCLSQLSASCELVLTLRAVALGALAALTRSPATSSSCASWCCALCRSGRLVALVRGHPARGLLLRARPVTAIMVTPPPMPNATAAEKTSTLPIMSAIVILTPSLRYSGSLSVPNRGRAWALLLRCQTRGCGWTSGVWCRARGNTRHFGLSIVCEVTSHYKCDGVRFPSLFAWGCPVS